MEQFISQDEEQIENFKRQHLEVAFQQQPSSEELDQLEKHYQQFLQKINQNKL